jgi:hypothetical protein
VGAVLATDSGQIAIAFIAVLGAAVSAGFAFYSQQRTSAKQVKREAEAVLARYREPLAGAAYELQGRLYNILKLDFLPRYLANGDESQRTYAVENTLYVVAQYFGWSEILRQEIQFLAFSDSARTREVNERQRRIVLLFQSDDPKLGRPFLIWRGEQHAIGEGMLDYDHGPVRCIGYATFLERRQEMLQRWLTRLEADLHEIAVKPNPRLTQLQHALVDLVRSLDPDQLRYPDEILAKV